ncbi:hypothetical protein BDF22DRAFT_73001 [Syncephalis plumigaleata]|nr:hypothetical protein BDF22DRAFT_73001 [Syncephalis plumigaleata]
MQSFKYLVLLAASLAIATNNGHFIAEAAPTDTYSNDAPVYGEKPANGYPAPAPSSPLLLLLHHLLSRLLLIRFHLHLRLLKSQLQPIQFHLLSRLLRPRPRLLHRMHQ